MKIVSQKILPVLMTMLLFIVIVPCGPLTVYAAVSAKNEKALSDAVSKAAGSEGGGEIRLTQDIALADCLRIPAGSPVALDLNGKTLNRGLSVCQDIGSVIRVEPGATLTIRDSSNENKGVITGGASWNGGGICNHGTLTIEGGTIRNNKALHDEYGGGGGIYNGSYQGSRATLTLTGGVIVNNQARIGAGIYNSDGTVFIKKGSYSMTVLSQLQTFETNVKITGNATTEGGSGIMNSFLLGVQDSPEISGNENDDDIYLANDSRINFTGKLTSPKKIGVSADADDATITSYYSAHQTQDPNDVFKSAKYGAILRMTAAEDGEVMLKTSGKTLVEIYEGAKRGEKKDKLKFERR